MKVNKGNVANHARHARVRAIERLNPGMVVVTRAFDIQSPDLEVRRREIAECRRIKEDFLAAKVAVKVVLNQDGAWVLREQVAKISAMGLQREACRTLWRPKKRACSKGGRS